MAEETRTVPAGTGIADPAPLGLAAFALTTFLLSAVNAGWAKNTTGLAWFGYAIAYGGVVQLVAGMWEVRNPKLFGAPGLSPHGAGRSGPRRRRGLPRAPSPPPARTA